MYSLSSLGGAGWQFFDNNGVPLSGGKLYTYNAGTTTNATTYTSSSGSTPNANPIVLDSAGRVSEEIWLIGGNSYKFVLRDANNTVIWTKDNVPGIQANAILDATSIEYDPPFPSAVTSNYSVSTKLAQTISVRDFGAVGDGITDDTNAINNAISYVLANPEAILWFENTTYLVGSAVPNGGSVFTIADGTSFTMRGRPSFRVTGTNTKGVNIFHIRMSNVDIEYVRGVGDAWTVPDVTAAIAVGITVIYVQNPNVGTTISRFNFGEVVADNCSRTVLFDANTKSFGLSSDVYIGTILSTDTCYALNCANSPNNLVCNQIIADNIFRAYFAYGVDNHTVNTQVKSTYSGIFAGGTCANISVFTESTPGGFSNRVGSTSNIYLTVDNVSARPTLQISTQSQAATDTSTGMYNIFANVFSTLGNALKIVNSIGSVVDTTTVFASPKQNIYIRAYGNGAALSSTDYGLFNTTNCYGLTLEASNFLDSALAARQAILTSGWDVIDGRFGLQIYKRFAVGLAGSNSFFNVAVNENPHLGIGSDTATSTRWRAGTAHTWFIGGTIMAYMDTVSFYPWTDNTMRLGGPSNRWTVVYAATGSINTSDLNHKQDVEVINDAERRTALRLKSAMKKFRFKDAVASKGAAARIHVGVIAQDVAAAFEAEGLDPNHYGVFCKDTLADGTIRYGVRYDELFAFIIAAI